MAFTFAGLLSSLSVAVGAVKVDNLMSRHLVPTAAAARQAGGDRARHRVAVHSLRVGQRQVVATAAVTVPLRTAYHTLVHN